MIEFILLWGATFLISAILIWAAISALVITYFRIAANHAATQAREGVSSLNSRPDGWARYGVTEHQAGDFSDAECMTRDENGNMIWRRS